MKRILYVLSLGIFGIATTEFGIIGILPQIAMHFVSCRHFCIPSTGRYPCPPRPVRCPPHSLRKLSVSSSPALRSPACWESPLITWMAGLFGWQASFGLCALFNGAALLGLWAWLPSLPVDGRVSYGDTARILRKPRLWWRLALACLMISAMYASYSYVAAYLGEVTRAKGAQISGLFLLFGIAGVGGNWLAGRMLSRSIPGTTLAFIGLLLLCHLFVFFAGGHLAVMTVMIFVRGFIHTGGFLISNINVSSAAPESPEFVNSLFTSCGNLAVTIGSTHGGLTIAHAGIHQLVLTSVGLLFLSAVVWGASEKASMKLLKPSH
ncbi:MAG: MFS transporter [Puia sp.]|nr:MFS transporter [Puia sp.]